MDFETFEKLIDEHLFILQKETLSQKGARVFRIFGKEALYKQLMLCGVVEPKGKLEMFQNMQYYMEHCQKEGYITPQDWLEKEKHF